jgi:putative ABC transport system substrate-binding protein
LKHKKIGRIATILKADPDALVSGGLFGNRAVQAANRTFPHAAISEDMVGDGFVTSLAHPGGNTTGISILSPELDGKRQEFLPKCSASWFLPR